MGFIRGSLLVFVWVLLLISLLGLNSLFIVSSSLEYNNVNNQIKSIVTDSTSLSVVFPGIEQFNITDQQQEIFDKAKKFCENQTDYVFSYEGYTIDIPCSKINSGSEAVINETVDDFVEGIYYKDYDCSYWQCFSKEKTPLFLISKLAHDYWQGKAYLMLLISFILVVLMFFLTQNKKNFPIVLGGVMIVSALPLLKLESFIIFAAGKFASFFANAITGIKSVFWISFVLGLILIGVGITLKVVGTEKVKKIFSKKSSNSK